jgi:HSP20 family protein
MLPVLRETTPLFPFAARPINRLDTFFDRFFGDSPLYEGWGAGVPIAMWEDDDHVYIDAELPGVAQEDVEVTVHNGMLFIRWERKPEEGRTYLYNGRNYGRSERVITLPDAVVGDDAQAEMADGVLHLTLTKSPTAKPKRIEVKAR